MKRLKILVLFVFTLFVIAGCTGMIKISEIADYHGEYIFKIPFDHRNPRMTSSLFFETDYSMEQMAQLIIEAGYGASLNKNGDLQTMLISAVRDVFTYYFVIFDKNYIRRIHPESESYTLKNATSTIFTNLRDRREGNVYAFLAPIHILGEPDGYGVRRLYGSFEYIADFYRATGKTDFKIDEENKRIYFECEGRAQFSWKQGTVVMQFIEKESGNYLHIKPLQ